MINKNHFNVSHETEFLFIINESISEIHPIYRNDPLNLYIILGTKRAMLVDTGCGLYPLKGIVEKIIREKELIVINTHTHWDHILGNYEFSEVYVHEDEANFVNKPYDVSFLKNSSSKIIKRYKKKDFLIPPTEKIHKCSDGKVFDLGEIKVKVIHTPGHSPGSICLYIADKILLTGDLAYYGDIFLPKRKQFSVILNSLSKLISLCQKEVDLKLYPSHKNYPCDISLLIELSEQIKNIEHIWDQRKFNKFFHSWELHTENFTFFISKI